MVGLKATVASNEALRIVALATEQNLLLRLMGGVGIYLHCREGLLINEFERDYVDLDFIGLSKDIPKIINFMVEMGYEPHIRFNAIMGSQRLLFSSHGSVDHVDILLDELRMCHSWDLRKRIDVDPITLPLADLLLSKLQIVNVTEKDFKDICLLLANHRLGEDDQDHVNGSYLSSLVGNDWGLWRTVTINLMKLEEFLVTQEFGERSLVSGRVRSIKEIALQAPKTITWKLRSAIGERMKWYELPEEVKR